MRHSTLLPRGIAYFFAVLLFAAPSTLLAQVGTKDVNCDAPGASLQAAINTAPAGSTIRIDGYCGRGPYFIFKDLTLIGTGPDKTVLATPGGTGDRVLHVGRSKVELKHFKVDATVGYGIILEERTSGILEDVEVENGHPGILVYLTSYASVIASRVNRNVLGIDIADSSSAWIESAQFLDNTHAGIRVRSSSALSLIATRVSGGNIGLEASEYSTVEAIENLVRSNSGPGVLITRNGSVKFHSDTVENNGLDVRCDRGMALFEIPVASSTQTSLLDPACFVEGVPFGP